MFYFYRHYINPAHVVTIRKDDNRLIIHLSTKEDLTVVCSNWKQTEERLQEFLRLFAENA